MGLQAASWSRLGDCDCWLGVLAKINSCRLAEWGRRLGVDGPKRTGVTSTVTVGGVAGAARLCAGRTGAGATGEMAGDLLLTALFLDFLEVTRVQVSSPVAA